MDSFIGVLILILSAGFFTDQSGRAEPKSVVVIISEMKFVPPQVVIHKGDTVIWKNDDLVSHCVTQSPGKTWTSSMIDPGKSWKKVFNSSSDYYCAIHDTMKGKILVK